MIKKVTKAAQVRSYVAANPKAKLQEVAKEIGVSLQYVYTVLWNAKKKAGVKKKTTQPVSIISSNTPMQIDMFESVPDPVNHPAHYKVGGIETIDFIEAKKLGYNLGNVVKYLTRADYKGKKREDLRKAQWYLTREINALK